MKIKKSRWLIAAAAALVLLGSYLAWGNWAVTVTRYTVTDDGIPAAFDGFRIAHVSDLHNTAFGKDNKRLLDKLRAAAPDIIVVTGDLIDSYHTDIQVSADFVLEAVQIAPVYYVTGNHESRIGDYVLLKAQMEAAGAAVMENEKLQLERDGQTITLLGVNDPTFFPGVTRETEGAALATAIEDLKPGEGYTVLLSHRPNYLPEYAGCGVDLVFSGHTHGGQFRLPFAGGLYSPSMGFFPDYDGGVWTEGDTTLIVSRGLGNSAFPLRVNNPPELVVAQLECA